MSAMLHKPKASAVPCDISRATSDLSILTTVATMAMHTLSRPRDKNAIWVIRLVEKFTSGMVIFIKRVCTYVNKVNK